MSVWTPPDPDAGGGERRRLDRAPGARYGGGPVGPPGAAPGASPGVPPKRPASGGASARGLAVAALVAAAGGLVFFLLGQLDLGPGLLAVAAFTGWVTGVAVVDLGGGPWLRPGAGRVAVAVALASGAILAAIVLDWAWAEIQGGVLGPLDYTWQRYGPAAILDVSVAGIMAGLHAR